MEAKELLRVLHTAERLKDETRHCYTSGGRRESVAEHSWRLALTALFLRDEFPALDMDRVIRMCLIHDLGECFTGDIPSFLKSGGDEERERSALETWVASLPRAVQRGAEDALRRDGRAGDGRGQALQGARQARGGHPAQRVRYCNVAAARV